LGGNPRHDRFPSVGGREFDQASAGNGGKRLIPGHPGAPDGRLGTKTDAQDQRAFLQDASEAVKVEARAGKCGKPAEKELKLPKYTGWPNYETALPFVLRRYCGLLWGRGP
jgi:hypothetical protein